MPSDSWRTIASVGVKQSLRSTAGVEWKQSKRVKLRKHVPDQSRLCASRPDAQ